MMYTGIKTPKIACLTTPLPRDHPSFNATHTARTLLRVRGCTYRAHATKAPIRAFLAGAIIDRSTSRSNVCNFSVTNPYNTIHRPQPSDCAHYSKTPMLLPLPNFSKPFTTKSPKKTLHTPAQGWAAANCVACSSTTLRTANTYC